MFNKVILVHGFNKTKRDMAVLAAHLRKQWLECFSADLPLTFETIEHCAAIFEGKFGDIARELREGEKISLVGHSSGGLVIRKFLTETQHLDRVNRCVLIATPNRGSKLADYAERASRTYTRVFKTLQSLHSRKIEELQLKDAGVEIGAIAGNKSNLLLGKLLRNANDGRVEVESVYYEGLNDFIVVPYGHKEIHYQQETAELVFNFIRSGRFRGE